MYLLMLTIILNLYHSIKFFPSTSFIENSNNEPFKNFRVENRNILYAKLNEKKSLLAVICDELNPNEDRISVLNISLNGEIISEYPMVIQNAISIKAFCEGSKICVGWIGTENFGSDALWVAEFKANKWEKKKLLEEEVLGEWWIVNISNNYKLYIIIKRETSKLTNENQTLIPERQCYLCCYLINNESLIFEGKSSMDIDNPLPDNFELSADDSNVFIWKTYSKENSQIEILSVSIWNNNGQLNWIDCYTGNLPIYFWIDPMYGSSALVAEWKNPTNAYPILCLVSKDLVTPISLPLQLWGGGMQGQLLHISNSNFTWLITFSNKIKSQIVFTKLNHNLQASQNVLPKTFDVCDTHMVYNGENSYLILLKKDGISIIKIPLM